MPYWQYILDDKKAHSDNVETLISLRDDVAPSNGLLDKAFKDNLNKKINACFSVYKVKAKESLQEMHSIDHSSRFLLQQKFRRSKIQSRAFAKKSHKCK